MINGQPKCTTAAIVVPSTARLHVSIVPNLGLHEHYGIISLAYTIFYPYEGLSSLAGGALEYLHGDQRQNSIFLLIDQVLAAVLCFWLPFFFFYVGCIWLKR